MRMGGKFDLSRLGRLTAADVDTLSFGKSAHISAQKNLKYVNSLVCIKTF